MWRMCVLFLTRGRLKRHCQVAGHSKMLHSCDRVQHQKIKQAVVDTIEPIHKDKTMENGHVYSNYFHSPCPHF